MMIGRDITTVIEQYGPILSHFFEHVSDMVFLMKVEEDLTFTYVIVNPAAMRTAGLREEAYGKRIDDIYSGEKAALLNSKYREAVLVGKPVSFIEGFDGYEESILTPIFNAEGECTHVFSVTRDITERKRTEEKLHYMAYHDILTGLPNRRLLQERIEQAIELAIEGGTLAALMYVDCDKFKSVNDSRGHDIGDELLQGVAKRLSNCVREVDTVARLGGDEFIVLLTDMTSISEIERIAQRVVDVMQQPWKFREHKFATTASIGIALCPLHATTMSELLSKADIALYQAKNRGRNCFQIYT
ncbi:diguanylate cyclase domain-containing protein [Brevibacillus dissolubilis]|uniref:diguanylate cyclase domain-containing protein n=1 Tax=Brevibacillus dissolubilis TaxID=1844116 RepID=UPI0020FFFF6A|nr:GGDEF domain-containing protein [Brevibacillus dissolubilis]